jgi:hypothetical protein
MTSRMLAALAAASMTFAFTACGGDDKEKPLSKADYIAKADAICKTEGAKGDAAAENLTENSTEAEFAAFQKAIVPGLEAQVSQLRDLAAPEADADKLNAIYDQVADATEKIKAADPAEIPTLFESDPFAKPNAEATAYGMKVCGQP